MEFNQFQEAIHESYHKYFPQSRSIVRLTGSYSSMIFLDFYLANDKEELINGYWENDAFNIHFTITGHDITLQNIPEHLTLEKRDTSFTTASDSQYMYASSKKVSFRKTEGNSTKIITTLDRFFQRLRDAIIECDTDGKLHPSHIKQYREKLNLLD